jgi:hypothetical protein
MSHRLRSSASKLDENIEDAVSLDAASPRMPLGTQVPEVRANKRVNIKSQISYLPKELGNQTSVEVGDVDILSQERAAVQGGMSKWGLKACLQPEETVSCVPESEKALSSVGMASGSTGPGAQADSQDVIESSQDSSASSTFLVPRLSSVHSCSVSVRRINMSLEAGAKIDISQGDQKFMVLIPPDSSSPFKVFSPENRSFSAVQEEKSEKAACEMESGDRTKLASATRSLYGKSGAVKPFDSVPDKPDVPRVERVPEPVCKVTVSRSARNVPTTRNGIPKQSYKRRKCEGNILNVGKTGAAKPKSTKSVGIITVKECVPATTADGAPRARSTRQARTRKPEVSFAVINVRGPPELRQRKSNALKHVDVPTLKIPIEQNRIAPVTVDNASAPLSEKQLDKSKPVAAKEQSDLLRADDNVAAAITDDTPETGRKAPEAGVSTVSKEDASKHRSGVVSAVGKEATTKPVCVHVVSAVGNENAPELQLKKQINIPRSEDGISLVQKEDAFRAESLQQISVSVSKVNVSVVNSEGAPESRSERQIDASQSENRGLALNNVDTPTPQSRNRINTSERDVSALTFHAEDDPEPRPKQQRIDVSVPVDSVSTANAEDTPELRFRLQINASKCEDDILKVRKKENPQSRSKQQDNALVCKSSVSAVCSEETPKLQSRQQDNASRSNDSVSTQVEGCNVRPQSNQQNNASGSKGNIFSPDKKDTQKPQSKQEINTPSSENCILMAVVKDTSKPEPKQSINASECTSILMRVKEGVPKPRSKRKKSEGRVLTAVKEDALKPGAKQICIQEPKVISLIDIGESELKLPVRTSRFDSALESDTPKSQPNIPKAEGNDAPGPELNSTALENFTVRVVDDNRESQVEDVVDILGTKVVLRLCLGKAVNREEPAKDKPQHSVKPKRVSINCRRGGRSKKAREKIELKLDHKASSADDSSPTSHKIDDKSDFTDNASDIAETAESKETGVLKEDSLLSIPLQSRKRLADSNLTLLELHHGKADSSHDDHIGTGGSKIKRLSQNAESIHTKSAYDCSPTSSPMRVKLCSDSVINRTPSPPSRSVLSSPSSFLQAFSSSVGSVEFQNHGNRHRPSSGGRAQYLVGLAVGVKDTETTQALTPVPPQKPEEARNIVAAASPSLPLSRKKLTYGVSNGNGESDAPPLERQVLFAYFYL